MSRSRKGLMGLLALGVVATLGLGGCSDGSIGWHLVGPDAPTFQYGPTECNFQMQAQPVLFGLGGTKAIIVDKSVGHTCAADMAKIRTITVSCMYVGGSAGAFYWDFPSDTCPASQSGGSLLWINMARTETTPLGG